MSRESPPSHFRTAFDAVLREYEKITNITLATHPIAEKLKNCHSVEATILLIQDLAREFGDFPGIDRLMKSINNSVSLLSMLAAIPVLGNAIGIVGPNLQGSHGCVPPLIHTIQLFPPIIAIRTGIAILLIVCILLLLFLCAYLSYIQVHQATKGVKLVKTSYKPLLGLLESIELLLRHLYIYTQIPPTPDMDEMVVKIMAEILVTLALMTKDLNQGRPSESNLPDVLNKLKAAQRHS